MCGSSLSASGIPFSNDKTPANQLQKPISKLSLLLDNLRSTLNVGSIFRTADGAGVAHIYCCGTTPTPEHPKIKKTGLGAEGFVSWSYHRNALDVPGLLFPGTAIVALEATKNSVDLITAIRQTDWSKPVLIIIGNENSGVDPELLKISQHILSLPMMGSKTSLNVAVASGIAIYALRFYTSVSEKIV